MSIKTINKRAMLFRQKAANAKSDNDRLFYLSLMRRYQSMLRSA